MNRFLLSTVAMACCFQSAFSQNELVPGEPTDFTGKFELVDGDPVINFQITAPTHEQSWDEPQLLTSIAKIEVVRSCYDLGESDEPVKTLENPAPGEKFSFSDSEIETGYTYSYSARAYNSEGKSGYAKNLYLFAGIQPQKPEFVSVTTADNGASPVTFVVKAPTTEKSSDPLSVPLTALSLKNAIGYNNEPEIHRIDNPEAGKEYTFTIPLEEGSRLELHLYASTAYGTGDYSSYTIFVGKDTPAAPTEMIAEIKETGVELSWKAPETGLRGGYIDPAATVYKVERVTSTGRKLLAENINACTFTDDCADINAPTQVSYTVTAVNAEGEGGYVSIDKPIVVGPAITLPFVENFNIAVEDWGYTTYSPENLWTYEGTSSYSTSWGYESSTWKFDSFTGIDGTDETPEGYACCNHSYADKGDYDNLVSSKINLTDAKCPVLAFHYATIMDVANRLKVSYRSGDEDNELIDFAISENAPVEAEVAWAKKTVSLGDAAGKEINLVFHAYIPEETELDAHNVYIDGIYLDDYPPVETVTVENEPTGITLTWEAPSNSTVTADAYDVTVNGKEPVRVTEPKFEITPEPDVDYIVTILARYGEIESIPSEEIKFSSKLSSILSITTEGTAKIEYFDVTGRKVTDLEEGMMLIKRSTLSDGTCKSEKLIYKNR